MVPFSHNSFMRKLGNNQQGGMAILMGLLLIPLIGAVGLAVDATRAYNVRMELQNSLDAAALVGGRLYSISSRDTELRSYFNANWNGGRYNAVAQPLQIVADTAAGTLDLSTTATMPTVLMKFLGVPEVTVAASAQVIRNETVLEVALAIDTTGSMDSNDNSGNHKMTAAKSAANLLLNILYNNQDSDDHVYVSVVPFVQNVNVGSNYSGWLAAGSESSIPWNSGPYPTSSGWRGCMFERLNGSGNVVYDTTDEPPATQRFMPYADSYFGPNCPAWASGQSIASGDCRSNGTAIYSATSSGTTSGSSGPTHSSGSVASGGITWRYIRPTYQGADCPLWASGQSVASGACRVHNRRIYIAQDTNTTGSTAPTHTGSTAQSDGRVRWDYWGTFWRGGENFSSTGNYRTNYYWQSYDNRSTGTTSGSNPPLQVSGTSTSGSLSWRYRTRLTAQDPYVNAQYGYGYNSGCGSPIVPMTTNRLTAKARVDGLEPSINYGGTMTNMGLVWAWRTISPRWRGLWSGVPEDRPYDYDHPENYKAVIILTDGANVFTDCGSDLCKGAATPYGYLPDGRLGTTHSGTAVNTLNSKVTQICDNIRNAGVLLYAVMFDLPSGESSTRTLFQNCVANNDRFFDVVNTNELQQAFEAIGVDLSRLRISR